jgi:hypothetical protein
MRPASRKPARVMLFASDLAGAIGWNTYSTPKAVARKILERKFPGAFAAAADGPVEAVAARVHAAATAVVEAVAAAPALAPKVLKFMDATSSRPTPPAPSAPPALDTSPAPSTLPAPSAPPAPSTLPAPSAPPRVTHAMVTDAIMSLARPLAVTTTVAALRTAVSSAQEAVEQGAGLPAEVTARVMSAARGAAYTERGRRDERSALDRYAAAAGVTVIGGDGRFMTRAASDRFCVGGKEDGRLADSTAVVEVKHRQNGLFHLLPRRELVQLYAYMHLTGMRAAVWVQATDTSLDFRRVEWADAQWAEICTAADAFCDRLQPYLRDVDAARRICAASDTLT